jgi:uncharacterized protein YicC (UPF0701 family)
MTGYGKSIVTYNQKKINVEIKSLNSKTLDLSTRIAPLYREKDMEIRQIVAKQMERGKIDFSIWIEKDDAVDAAPINAALVENYYNQIKAISEFVIHFKLSFKIFANYLTFKNIFVISFKATLVTVIPPQSNLHPIISLITDE